MDDMERYGDYNEVDEPPSRNKVLTAIKIIALVLIFSVVGLIAARLIMFNYYPGEMKRLYFNDTLSEYYELKDGDIGAKTQKLKAPYDDEKEGNFFCDHLIFIPKLGQLQITVRYNNNLLSKLQSELKLTDEQIEDGELFSFRLNNMDFAESASNQIIDKPSDVIVDEVGMYTYRKLVFDGVDFEKSSAGGWAVLEIFVKGQKKPEEPYAKIMILDYKEEYYSIKDYDLSGGEKPR